MTAMTSDTICEFCNDLMASLDTLADVALLGCSGHETRFETHVRDQIRTGISRASIELIAILGGLQYLQGTLPKAGE